MKVDTVNVIFASEGATDLFVKRNKAEKIAWVYLGEDSLKALRIEQKAPQQWERISIAETLQKEAKKNAGRYVEYISGLCGEKDIRWWASRLSEKNPFVSKAFLHICYLKVAEQIIESAKERVTVIFVEDKDVFDAILSNWPEKVDGRIRAYDKLALPLARFRRFLVKKAWFLLATTYQLFLSRHLMKKRMPEEDLTVIHTFANERSFDPEDRFRESYFGKMPQWLNANGNRVALLVRVLDNRNFGKIARKLAKNKDVMVWQRCISFWDMLGVFLRSIFDFRGQKNVDRFGGLDVRPIIHHDKLEDWIENRKASDLLLYYGIKGMAKDKIKIGKFIHTYENHCWEKTVTSALREFYPKCKIIGYQHAALSKMQLNYFFTKQDLESMPFPDKIIASGEYYADVFNEAGYPEGTVEVGGSFRFAYLLDGKLESLGSKILVTFTLDDGQTAELYAKVVEAFRDGKMDVILKFHPFSDPKRIMTAVGGKLLGNFSISAASMPDALRESGTLIYTTSTTCIEAIAAGIIPINVASEHFVDMDQLEEYPEVRLRARTPEEIAMMARTAIKQTGRKDAGKLVEERFARVDRDAIISIIA